MRLLYVTTKLVLFPERRNNLILSLVLYNNICSMLHALSFSFFYISIFHVVIMFLLLSMTRMKEPERNDMKNKKKTKRMENVVVVVFCISIDYWLWNKTSETPCVFFFFLLFFFWASSWDLGLLLMLYKIDYLSNIILIKVVYSLSITYVIKTRSLCAHSTDLINRHRYA